MRHETVCLRLTHEETKKLLKIMCRESSYIEELGALTGNYVRAELKIYTSAYYLNDYKKGLSMDDRLPYLLSGLRSEIDKIMDEFYKEIGK